MKTRIDRIIGCVKDWLLDRIYGHRRPNPKGNGYYFYESRSGLA